MIVFLVDDYLNVVYKDRVINYRLKDIIDMGLVVDKDGFIKSFMDILKKEKIKGKLFGDNIKIVKNSYYRESDVFFLDHLFLEIGFAKVEFIDISSLFFRSDTTYLEINDKYMVINLDKGLIVEFKYVKDIPKVIDYFSDSFKSWVVLFGNNSNIPLIKSKSRELFYFDNYKNYIAESLLKVKKYDV